MSVEAQVLEMIEAGAVEGVPGDVRRALKRRAEETRAPGRKAGALDQLPAPIRSSMLSRGQLRAAGMASGGSGWEARSGTLNGVVRENAFSFVLDITVKDGVLYVGGGGIPFTGNGKRINNIARFDGTQWEVLGSGLLNTSDRGEFLGQTLPAVEAIAVADDGTVYAGGHFTETGSGTPVNHVAKYNGNEWVQVGSGLVNPDGLRTATIEVLRFDDSETLHAVGRFTENGDGQVLNHVARFDGGTWQSIGEGFGSRTLSMAFDASGELYVGGRYEERGDGQSLLGIARFDGTEWVQVGTGLTGGVSDLAFDGSGVLYAGGGINERGDGTSIRRVAQFQNGEWTEVGSGLNETVAWVAVNDDDELYAAGEFTTRGDSSAELNRVARYDGSAWQRVGAGLGNDKQETSPVVGALAFDANGTLYAGGGFDQRGSGTGPPLNHLATFTGGQWEPAVSTASSTGINGTVYDAVSHDGDLYIGGDFSHVGTMRVNGVARWDGTEWHAVGEGLTGWGGLFGTPVRALAVDDGGTVYAGGGFSERGNEADSLNRVARFDGSAWEQVGSGLGDPTTAFPAVEALVVDGTGTLYAGGRFQASGDGETVNYVASFENEAWTSVSGGTDSFVHALALDGTDLIAGGEFSSTSDGGTEMVGVGRFDGTEWRGFGQGLGRADWSVWSLAVDSGGTLYAAGSFTEQGDGTPMKRVARWDGEQGWQQVGVGLGNPDNEFATVRVHGLSVAGGALYAAGEFLERGDGAPLNHVARLEGGTWRSLGAGTNGTAYTLHASDELVVGGDFLTADETFTPRMGALSTTLVAATTVFVEADGPVGFGSTGVGMRFSGTSGSGDVRVAKYGDGPSGTDGISESNVSTYRFVIGVEGTLDFDTSTDVRLAVASLAGIDDPTNVTLYRRPDAGSGTFASLGTNVDDNGTPSDISDDTLHAAIEGLGEFVLASDSEPLPVELAEFTATLDGTTARLRWRTGSEANNARFEVLHQAPEAERYARAGAVESTAEGGTTTEPQTYRFAVSDLKPGTHRFQLRQVDLDGRATRTEAVTVVVEAERALALQMEGPNPVRQSTRLAFTVKQSGTAEVVLFNVLGQQVQTLRAEEAKAGRRHSVEVPAGDLTSGVYFVRLKTPSGTRTHKITVVR